MHHRPSDTATLTLGPIKLVLYLDPRGPSTALWFLVESGRLIGAQRVGEA